MNFRTLLTLAASSAVASADSVYLVAKSNSTEVNGNGVGFAHEGAGINYGFLGTGKGSTLSYSAADKQLTLDTGVEQFFRVSGGFVAASVEGPDAAITFDSNDYLLVNGSSSYFYACKNTNDPYKYSASSYEVMYYPENAPSGCLSLTLQKKDVSGPSSSGAPTTTPGSNSTIPVTSSTLSTSSATASHSAVNSTSIFTDAAAAAMDYAPAGSFFALVGLAAALI